MNENSTKKILFNKSTLISLKAELIKKQSEVAEKKSLSHHKLENFKPAKEKKHQNPTRKSLKNNFKAWEEKDREELEACRKSKQALEKKAELYNHLLDDAGVSQLSNNFLVDFNTKKKLEPQVELSPEPDNTQYGDENDWVEYTDCLGRTRMCIKEDLEKFKERDRVLVNHGNKNKEKTENDHRISKETAPNVPEKPILVQTTNDFLQSLRAKWEQKEKEMLEKDGDIHYQDVLFDEARMHGVGYFSFSTNEAERRKQMEELVKTREETVRAQKGVEESRKQMDEMIAARVAASKAKLRQEAGLPPEDPEETRKDFTESLLEFLNKQKSEADLKAKERETKMKAEVEQERQKLRDAYIREWDVGKEGTEKKSKKFREMTQEEYVEQQRDKRIKEFAPFETCDSAARNSFDSKGKLLMDDAPKAKTWADVRPSVSTEQEFGPEFFPEHGLRFASKKPDMKYKNFIKQTTPIVNELREDVRSEKRKVETGYAAIAPPPTFDYYGPSAKQFKSNKPFYSNLNEAYDQGVKSLEPKSDKAKLSQQYDFIF